ncbi:MAG: hypothetical protein LCI00_04240 [Chloroflexi bacterium]|nr:hypothetical protein [Chloroflexota bacterium]MCC6894063.1 hypothetical protein [Anaerolineae bacterium]
MDINNSALNRILALKFYDFNDSSKSQISTHVLLMKEYLRRMLLWKKALKIDQWPFHGLSKHLYTFSPLETDYIYQQLQSVRFPNAHVAASCMAFILWSQIENRENVQAFNLPTPYEPLIRMYESGCWFSKEENMIDLWNNLGESENMILISKYYDTLIPFIDLD